jgi:hypothetical protein
MKVLVAILLSYSIYIYIGDLWSNIASLRSAISLIRPILRARITRRLYREGRFETNTAASPPTYAREGLSSVFLVPGLQFGDWDEVEGK